MVIEILGTGCAKCEQLAANAGEALKKAGIAAEVNKVTRLNEIMKYNVMITPALVVDGDVKSSGKVLSVEQIIKIIAG